MKLALLTVTLLSMFLGFAAAEPARGPFRLDSDEFPIGMYSIDSPGAMAQAEGLGIDYVQNYGTGSDDKPESIAKDVAYLDLAEKHGRRVAFQFAGRKLVDRPDGVQTMTRIIDAVKGHPALGFWIFYDEPGGRHSPEQLLPFYQAAKKASPAIPFGICHSWRKNVGNYKNVADLNLFDYYPVQHETFPQARLNLMTRFTETMVGIGLPAMPINQCFNWQAIAREKKVTEYRHSPVDKMRFPNQAELRYLAYSGLAQGVRGMFWWSYHRSVMSDAGWLAREFAPVNREFRDFTRLVTPAHRGEIVSAAKGSDILAARWRRPSGEYWLVVNARAERRPLAIEMTTKGKDTPFQAWGSTRKTGAAIRDGMLKVESVEPWEVLILKCGDSSPLSDERGVIGNQHSFAGRRE